MYSLSVFHATVTTSHKSVPYEPCKEIFMEWSRTWVPCGSYGVNVAIKGITWLLPSLYGAYGKVASCHAHPVTTKYYPQLPYRPCNCHEIVMFQFGNSFHENFLAFMGRFYVV